jgi:hypothetical protein
VAEEQQDQILATLNRGGDSAELPKIIMLSTEKGNDVRAARWRRMFSDKRDQTLRRNIVDSYLKQLVHFLRYFHSALFGFCSASSAFQNLLRGRGTSNSAS